MGFGSALLKRVSGVWRAGVDPGGLDARGSSEPPGMGDVRLRLLLRHDLPLDDHLYGRMPQEQLRLGRCCKKRRPWGLGSRHDADKTRLTCDRALFVSRTLFITDWQRFST